MNGFKLKNNFFIFFFLFFLSFPLFSKPNIKLGINSGIHFGSFGEYIFNNKQDDAYIVSYLEWQAKPLFSLGYDFSITNNKIQFYNNTQFYLPNNCGSMFDSDFTENKIKTTYSQSQNQNIFGIDTIFGINHTFYKNLVINLQSDFCLEYSFIKFKARNGFMYDGRKEKTGLSYDIPFDNINAIYYEQGRVSGANYYKHSLDFFCGINCNILIKEKSQINLAFLFTLFSYALENDTHLTKKNTQIYFIDFHKQYGFFNKIKINLDYEYNINLKNKIKINSTLLFSNKLYGTLLTNRINNTFYNIGQKTASDAFMFSINVGYEHKF